MKIKDFRYYKGGRDCYEAIECDVTKGNGDYVTTCVINCNLLLCGINSHPCGNGDDLKFDPEQRLEVLEFLQEQRKKITDKYPVKTHEGWYESGLPTFEDYCSPGDTVDEAMVDYFMNCVPPVAFRSDCSQAGEAFSHEPDEHKRYRATYTTFHRAGEGLWVFDGYCFRGENENRVNRQSKLQTLIYEARREAERDRLR